MARKATNPILLLISTVIPVIFGIGVVILIAQPWDLWDQEWFIEEGEDVQFIKLIERGISILLMFTLTCYAFFQLIKKRKIKPTYWIIGLSYLILTLISAFSAGSYSGFRVFFFNEGIEYMWLGYLWISFFCLPLILIIIHGIWLYSKNLKSWFQKHYFTLLNWVIATPILLVISYNSKAILTSLSNFKWDFSTIRNIITTAFFLIVLAIGSRYVSYRVISRKIRKAFFSSFLQMSRLIISALVGYIIIFSVLVFINPYKDADELLFYNDFNAAVSNANQLFPFNKVWSWLLGTHIALWVLANTKIRLGPSKEEQKGWINEDDPWLPRNVIEEIPEEVLEIEEMSKWNRLSHKNISKAMKNADIGLEKLHALKIKYNQFLERWKNQETLSDENWVKYGDKKGSRTQEYSRFSVGNIKSIFLEHLFEVDYYIRETNRIQTKFLGKEISEMAFQQPSDHNISSKKEELIENQNIELSPDTSDVIEIPQTKKFNTDDFE